MQKGFTPIVALIGILVITLIAGCIYYFNTNANRSTNSQFQPQNIKPSPAKVNLPTANINSVKGKLILRSDEGILVSNTNGKNIMKLIDSQNKIGFSGWSDEGRVIYYTELAGDTFTTYRKDLSSGVVDKLFSFTGGGFQKNEEFYYGNVAVSSDGKYAIYSHNNGDISLYNLINKTNKKILSQKTCLSQSGKEKSFALIQTAYAGQPNCFGYFFPYWSPDNQRVILHKIFYEGATNVIINIFDDQPHEKDVKTGGGPPQWLDANRLVIPGEGYGPGNLYLITGVNDPIKKDLLAENSEYKHSVNSAATSTDGKIAFNYSIYGGSTSRNGVALLNLSGNSVKGIATDDDLSSVELWLPDNKTILYLNSKGNLWSLEVDTLSKQSLDIPVKINNALIVN